MVAWSPKTAVNHWYENLGDDEFQKLCSVLITGKYDKVTCYPVGQKNGGRDITQKTGTGQSPNRYPAASPTNQILMIMFRIPLPHGISE